VGELLASGLVCEGEPIEREQGGPGRRIVPLSLLPDSVYMVGTDLEGGALRACVLNGCREIVAGETRLVGADWSVSRMLTEWQRLVAAVIAQSAAPLDRLAVVGGGLPGVVERGGFHTRAFLPPGQWTELDASVSLAGHGVPAAAANNVLCVSEYERRLGAATGEPGFLSILVRYGLGAALYGEGRLLSGETDFAGEFGHMRVFADGPQCVCGLRGCLDVRTSGRTMPDLARLTPGERLAVLGERAEALGQGIANLLKVFHPPMVLLNGVYNPFADEFRPLLAAAIEHEFGQLPLTRPRLVFGEQAEFKTSIGAALRAAAELLPAYFETRLTEL
jgi:predicted NBD/HSP70 family sugar kinase